LFERIWVSHFAEEIPLSLPLPVTWKNNRFPILIMKCLLALV
jgi:hypothetical protein